jgi:hypothetical protein
VATQAMERLVSWGWSRTSQLYGHADNLKGSGRDCIGAWNMDAVSNRPRLQFTVSAANDMLKAAGFQPGAVSQTWAARGWLVGDKSSSCSKVVSIGGVKVRMYELSTAALALHVWSTDLASDPLFDPEVPF